MSGYGRLQSYYVLDFSHAVETKRQSPGSGRQRGYPPLGNVLVQSTVGCSHGRMLVAQIQGLATGREVDVIRCTGKRKGEEAGREGAGSAKCEQGGPPNHVGRDAAVCKGAGLMIEKMQWPSMAPMWRTCRHASFCGSSSTTSINPSTDSELAYWHFCQHDPNSRCASPVHLLYTSMYMRALTSKELLEDHADGCYVKINCRLVTLSWRCFRQISWTHCEHVSFHR